MRRHVVNAVLLIALSLLIPECARAALPYLDITSDVQRPDEEFVIKRVYSGNTPLIRWTATDDSVASKRADLDGWSFVLWYAADNSATSGWSVAQSSVASNQVVFSSITNFFAIPNDNYYVSIKGIHQSGWVRTWGVGRMNQKWDFATGNPYTNTQGILNTTQLNWSVFASYSGAWPFYAGSNITLTSSGTGLVISASASGGGSATNGINSVLTASGATGAVSFVSNVLTVSFPTNGTASLPSVFTGSVKAASSAGLALLNSSAATTVLFGAGGGLSAMFSDGASFSGVVSGNGSGLTNLNAVSGAYSTSALLTLATSGTNIVGGLSESVATSGQWNAIGALASNAVSGAYSTSALLTLAVSGTNIVGGLSAIVATGTPVYAESDPLFAAASNSLMSATGTATRTKFGQFIINTNKITLDPDTSATRVQIIAGEERNSFSQNYVGARLLMGKTNDSSPGFINIATPPSTGFVSLTASEYVAVESTRFDGDAISNAAGTITIGKIQMPYWSTGSVPLSAGFTNVVTINDAQGQGAINQYWGRMDFRSYWAPPFMVYRLATNLPASPQIAQSWWIYDGVFTSSIPSNAGVYVTFGPHTANKAINGAAIGSIARGTNDGMHDLQLMTSDSATNLAERARLTSEGDFRLNGGKYYGDGSQLTNLPSSGASANPFTNFYVNAVASPTNRFQFTVPTNELWSRIEINLTAYQTNDAAQGFVYFRLNGATGTNVLYAYQVVVFSGASPMQAPSMGTFSNDASGAYSGRLYAPHNYSNAACRVSITLHDIYDAYPAKTYFANNWTKPRTASGATMQYIEQNYGSVSIGAVVTGVEVLAIGTVFDTGTVLRVRGMP